METGYHKEVVMAKIRSTLDIVLEKTKGLSLSESEREDLRRKSLEDKVRGWVQLFQDDKYTLEDLKARVEEEAARSRDVMDILRRELVGRMDPDGDSTRLQQALQRIIGEDCTNFAAAVEAYRNEMKRDRDVFVARVRERLAGLGVRGKAVVPNLEADAEWKDHVRSLKERFRASLHSHQR